MGASLMGPPYTPRTDAVRLSDRHAVLSSKVVRLEVS
jgi:hypothetical protein